MYLENISLSSKTPNYIKQKLDDIGIKTIHPVVDILNYIMIDIGQPMHAYDADKIGDKISVKHSKNNEAFIALDGNEYKLEKNNLVITDPKKIISLAGIIGAEDSSVKSTTRNIIIESAFLCQRAWLIKLENLSYKPSHLKDMNAELIIICQKKL